jgi:hypothetical protein
MTLTPSINLPFSIMSRVMFAGHRSRQGGAMQDRDESLQGWRGYSSCYLHTSVPDDIQPEG